MATDNEIDSLQWHSIIDTRFTTKVIYPNHPSFKKMYDNYFKVYGLAFLHFKAMNIFIDGQELLKDGYTPNHIYAIEAHEIAHFILEHDKDSPSIEQEKSADVAAIEILDFLKHYEAKELLIRRFSLLYKCDPNKDDILSPKEKEALIRYLEERKPSFINKIKNFLLKFKK
jgi:hypothetical protein